MSGHGHTIRARAAGPVPLVAVDLVVDKLEHQIERTKGRIVGRSQPRHRLAPTETLFRRVRTA
jgi:ribosome-associated translation inhibitor RaiA